MEPLLKIWTHFKATLSCLKPDIEWGRVKNIHSPWQVDDSFTRPVIFVLYEIIFKTSAVSNTAKNNCKLDSNSPISTI